MIFSWVDDFIVSRTKSKDVLDINNSSDEDLTWCITRERKVEAYGCKDKVMEINLHLCHQLTIKHSSIEIVMSFKWIEYDGIPK